jgi:hypothetical protein
MAYVKGQVAGHAMMVDMLKMYSKAGKDSGLKAYAKKLMPNVERY